MFAYILQMFAYIVCLYFPYIWLAEESLSKTITKLTY